MEEKPHLQQVGRITELSRYAILTEEHTALQEKQLELLKDILTQLETIAYGLESLNAEVTMIRQGKKKL